MSGGQAPAPESFELKPAVPVPDFARRQRWIAQQQGANLPRDVDVRRALGRSLELREDVGWMYRSQAGIDCAINQVFAASAFDGDGDAHARDGEG